MTALIIPEDLRRSYIDRVGQTLVGEHGRERFYTPEQVKVASSRVAASSKKFAYIDWHCWAMCVFCAAGPFDAYHASVGEDCDYVSMKSEMMATLSDGGSNAQFDPDGSWMDGDGIDLSSIFDWF